MKYIGIIGSRRRDSLADFVKTAVAFQKVYEYGDVIVSGGCKQGGDRFAEILAELDRQEPKLYLPNQNDLDPKLPTRVAWCKINYARNILLANNVDMIIACVAPDRTGGTEHTLKHFCKRFGIDPRTPTADPNNQPTKDFRWKRVILV